MKRKGEKAEKKKEMKCSVTEMLLNPFSFFFGYCRLYFYKVELQVNFIR